MTQQFCAYYSLLSDPCYFSLFNSITQVLMIDKTMEQRMLYTPEAITPGGLAIDDSL